MIKDKKLNNISNINSVSYSISSINENTDNKTSHDKSDGQMLKGQKVKRRISQSSLKAIKLYQMQIEALDRPTSNKITLDKTAFKSSNKPHVEYKVEHERGLNDELASFKMLRTSNNSLICMHTQEALSRQFKKRYFSNSHLIKSWHEQLN